MDGLAYGATTESLEGDAVRQAKTPVLDALYAEWPHARLQASGPAVGLPEGQMGNSEVGHLNMGAGRVVYQELTRIDLAIADGSLVANDVLADAIDAASGGGRTVHLMGLVSDGGVHSSIEHLYALVEMAASRGAEHVAVHCFLDGRDTAPESGRGFVSALEARLAEIGVGRIATVMGRYYAMDRDNRWDRVERAWRAIALGEGTNAPAPSADAAIGDSYASCVTDEVVVPAVIGEPQPVRDGDAVIFFNFRPDRARELTRAFTDADFTGFERPGSPRCRFVCLTEYDPTIDAPVAFPKQLVTETLSEVIASHGMRQLHIAETEKYAHVTFFFNGGVETPRVGEERVLIPSPQVATYDLQPEMSAPLVGDALVAAIAEQRADLYIVNFANGDMVGHTGVVPAAIRAVQEVDTQVGRVVAAMREVGGAVLITADHGNAEQMIEHGAVCTAHSLHPVPLIAVDADVRELANGRLADVAPTVLDIMGLAVPESWSGRTLALY